ncbi:prepilin-type N-terminal cleavage/methylation domain-containing protein [Clostridium sp. NSJ-145]|uniref:prepilin-type N-terminal cleavage/methylation domain-containing protein n=1 Tax=Clostridium sp. NSJ-145 TaxID=2897777 RepID=UPI001E2C98BE|nr:prepilin-type N-terminal cleavage/methylation domain-containing protein [Clostridium sp. NSJ-145]MCD2502924.1 prepilin-type N-terminal cleavage/methylation domain-containing protein [Clostridium sp. NSJ-145]
MIKNNKSKSHSKKRAFTLIELVVVIAIVAVLAAAFTPKLSGYMDEARKVVVLDQAKRVLTAYENLNLKFNTLTEKDYIESVVSLSGSPVTLSEITKIPSKFTIEDCRNLLNTEKYDFTMTNGIVTTINSR